MSAGLSPDDRELIRAALGKVDKRIVMNILQKIESGGIPTPREMEILHSASAPSPASKAPVPVAAATPAPELMLETADAPQGQAWVAERYKVSLRTVKRWAAAGREHKDPPPYHSPPLLVSWSERMCDRKAPGFRQGVPEEILDAARISPTPAESPPIPSDSLPEAAADIEGLDIDLTDWNPADVTFDHGVDAAKMNFKVQARLLRQAFESKQEDRIRGARTAFKEALDLYREVERDRKKIMADQGELLRRDEVRKHLLAIHSAIPATFKVRLKDAFATLAAATESRAAWETFIESLVDDICRRLVDSRFAAPEKAA